MISRILGAAIVVAGLLGPAMAYAAKAPAETGDVRTDHQAPARDGARRDPAELCERLGGIERELCVRQAQENRDAARLPGIGATPGSSATGQAPTEPRPPAPHNER